MHDIADNKIFISWYENRVKYHVLTGIISS